MAIASAGALGYSHHRMTPCRVFVLDNLDSFTFNVAQQLWMVGAAAVMVRRAEAASVEEVATWEPTHLVLSPGPLRPERHSRNAELLEHFVRKIPVLGICLGMQAMNVLWGGTLKCDHPPLHGKTSHVHHDATALFAGVPRPMTVARYHSLVVDQLGAELQVTARTADDRIMGIRHQRYPMFGVQFHPESFLTRDGDQLMRNFLNVTT